MRDWDPIGVSGIPEAQDEYDSYVGAIYRLLTAASTEEEIYSQLIKIQTRTMEVPVHDQSHLRHVANKLVQLDVSLVNK